MRALYLAPHQPWGARFAGYTHTRNICAALAAEGHDVVLVTGRSDGPGAPPPPPPGVTLHTVAWDLRYPIPGEMTRHTASRLLSGEILRVARFLHRLVRKERIEVVQERHDLRLEGSLLAVLRDGPAFVTEVNSPFLEERYPVGSAAFRLRDRIRRLCWDAADGLVVQTEPLAALVRPRTRRPVRVVPNGADPRHFSPDADPRPARERWHLPEADTVTFIGSFRPWHGVGLLLDAFAAVAARRPGARLVLAGGGEGLAGARAQARNLCIAEKVAFTGPLPYDDLPSLLAASSVVTAPFEPSRWAQAAEPLKRVGMWWSPLKVFEAMAAGRAVVATASGVVPEYLGGTGVVVPEGAPGRFAEAVLSLLENPSYRVELGARARERLVQNYTWAHAARRTVGAWDEFRAHA